MYETFDEVCGLKSVEDKWVQPFIKRLKERYSLQSVILFGSRAQNRNNSWSDYDIFIESDDFKGMKPWERMESVMELWQGDRPIEPICLTSEELLSNNSFFIRSILETGLKINLT
jgi:predicted nucleotidyltransferase